MITFSLTDGDFGVKPIKPCALDPEDFHVCVWKWYSVGLTFQSVTHLELIFASDVGLQLRSDVSPSFHWLQNLLSKRVPPSTGVLSHLCQKSLAYICACPLLGSDCSIDPYVCLTNSNQSWSPQLYRRDSVGVEWFLQLSSTVKVVLTIIGSVYSVLILE